MLVDEILFEVALFELQERTAALQRRRWERAAESRQALPGSARSTTTWGAWLLAALDSAPRLRGTIQN